ncbi:hypothetical protein ABZZ17_06435 [Streptomyces sp. NPDC006512]|uniref:hypothetical protein n=1 Tax=Streptomyces sp. NPDC006512 TaxID=3154307 RepID=UPI0033B5D7EE
MSIRQTGKVRGGAAVVVVAALAITLVGCGGGEDNGKSQESPKASTPQTKGSEQAPGPSAGKSAQPLEELAIVTGASGMTLVINSMQRDPGGFLTVNGQIKNTGSQSFAGTSAWRGIELKGSGESVAGATLVDKVGKKRYYVLRDTEARCLCTTGISSVDPGQTIPFFAQFPAPPASTTEVDFNLPTFATATVKISG